MAQVGAWDGLSPDCTLPRGKTPFQAPPGPWRNPSPRSSGLRSAFSSGGRQGATPGSTGRPWLLATRPSPWTGSQRLVCVTWGRHASPAPPSHGQK